MSIRENEFEQIKQVNTLNAQLNNIAAVTIEEREKKKKAINTLMSSLKQMDGIKDKNLINEFEADLKKMMLNNEEFDEELKKFQEGFTKLQEMEAEEWKEIQKTFDRSEAISKLDSMIDYYKENNQESQYKKTLELKEEMENAVTLDNMFTYLNNSKNPSIFRQDYKSGTKVRNEFVKRLYKLKQYRFPDIRHGELENALMQILEDKDKVDLFIYFFSKMFFKTENIKKNSVFISEFLFGLFSSFKIEVKFKKEELYDNIKDLVVKLETV